MSERDPSQQGWQQVGSVSGLAEAREDAHWAMQLLAAVGYTHIDPTEDDRQSNAGWVDGMQVLAGRRIEREPVCFVSLAPAQMILALHEPGGEALEEFSCTGKSLDEAHAWVEAAIARRQDGDPVTLKRPEYIMPDHALAEGAAFGAGSELALQELARWFHNSNLVMRDLRREFPRSSAPRVWPHHFDIGMLISLEEDGDAQHGRSIGIGLSPGDENSAAPYWYVTPYPAVEGQLPEPQTGSWNTEGWTGFTLTASETIAVGGGEAQEALTRRFLDESISVCRGMLMV
jgi:hypothetical protein